VLDFMRCLGTLLALIALQPIYLLQLDEAVTTDALGKIMKSKFWGGTPLGAGLLLMVLAFLVGTKVFSIEPTLVQLNFQDAQGRKVKVTTATLVLVAGNYIDKLPLKISAKGLDLPMDASWLNANWPGGTSRLKNLDRAFVFLKAPGYALLCSDPIHWMGTETSGSGNNVIVSFPRSKTMVVSRGRRIHWW